MKSRSRGYVFTMKQETYLAELLADPYTWSLLDGPGDKNSRFKPKTEVRGCIAEKINFKFSTDEKPLSLEAFQIKNKVETMKRVWKRANLLLKETGNGDLPDKTLKNKILQTCHFYYITAEVWSASLFMNPKEPCQLTGTGIPTREFPNTGDETSEEGDEHDAVVGQLGIIEEQQGTSTTKKQHRSIHPSRTLRKRGTVGTHYVSMRKGLSDVIETKRELKRRKLEMEEKVIESNCRLQDAQIRFMEIQGKKLQAEIQSTVKPQAEIQNENRIDAEMGIRLLEFDLERARIQVELVRAQAELLRQETELEHVKRKSP
ncbi:hypothetical protein BGZ54_007697 [Gamsiella multidivaricata]|nr:hypothetical protein BGZ54_007697 [Gamsiella multidivaricata]